MNSIGTVISYCTNDFRFIGKCIEEAKRFSKQILIPVCDHFFDGTPENRVLLNHTYAQHPDCQFIEFAYLPNRIYSCYHSMDSEDPDWAIFWASTARYIGLHYLAPSIEYVLFLDSDEIVEGERFLQWLNSGTILDAQRLAAYFYGLTPTSQSKQAVHLSLFAKKESLAPLTFFNGLERIGVYMSHPGPKREGVVGLDGRPMVHHYSWTRTREECLWKTRTWSHRNDEDWPTLIDEAFSGQTKRLFDRRQHFEEIPRAYFDPFAVSLPSGSSPSSHAHVLKVNDRDISRKEIEYAFF